MQKVLLPFQYTSQKSVTFLGKMDYPIHRWFRMTASYSPELIDDIIDNWKLGTNDVVFDPFCGVGTTQVCCQAKYIPSASIEINPFFTLVSKAKTSPYSLADLEFLKKWRNKIESLEIKVSIDKFNPITFPIINLKNYGRWFSSKVLAGLRDIKKQIDNVEDKKIRDLLRVAILSILIEVSNADYKHVSLSFLNKPKNGIDVKKIFLRKINEIIDDLEMVGNNKCDADIFLGDSRDIKNILGKKKITAVITSPPYPNRFSYIRETRPHIYFYNLLDDEMSTGDLDLETIGGTWGKATSILTGDRFTYKEKYLEKMLDSYVDEIEKKDGKHARVMANYLIKYFNDMDSHLKSLLPVLDKNARLVYVIGNSKFYGIELPIDEMLSKLMKNIGYKTGEVIPIRKRNSKTGLRESLVFAEKP